MAVVVGTNSGFVLATPSIDPSGSEITIDTWTFAQRDTSPVGSAKIVEVGWYCADATEEANYEVGLYSDSTDLPATLLYSARTNAKGTGAGWKSVIVDWAISASTTYWIGVQLDDTATATHLDYNNSAGGGNSRKNAQATLAEPFGVPTTTALTQATAIYGKYELGNSATDNMTIIGENIY